MNEKSFTPKICLLAFGALLALLALTIGMTYVDLGSFNVVIGLGISLTKAMLIALFFMNLKWSSGLIRLTATAGAVWFVIFVVLTLMDFATRH